MYFIKRNNKYSLTLEGKNAITGYLFLLPFIIGFLAFMFFPIIESLTMVFSDVKMDPVKHGFNMEYIGIENIRRVVAVDADFNRFVTEEIGRMLLIVPAIIIFSLFVALILNQEFKARGFVRAIFFLPVILSSGIMIGLETNNSLLNSMSDIIKEGNLMKSSVTGVLEDILVTEGAASDFMGYIFQIINQIYDIAMASGIQIIIFLSALQTIPPSMFEAAKIEGATSWECFWKITFPMVSSLILVNIVYSVVDYFLRTDNRVMEKINEAMIRRFQYGFGTAMAWIYFLSVMLIIGIAITLISRKVYYYE
ncbi:MAG: sugar ABC transporter permease [Treponema sp.]|jgi:ABC-type sugar transport system permease subunit|nr:sugar ABC transporter permease [Treponema sp.]